MAARPDQLLFFASCTFVAGTIFGGLGAPPLIAVLILVPFFCVALFWKMRVAVLAGAAVLFLAGNSYYAVDDYMYREAQRAVASVTQFEGIIVDEPRRGLEAQTAKVELTSSDGESISGGRVYLRVDLFPELAYGDIVRVSGAVVPPPTDSYGNYMAKEHIHGSMFYPNVEVLGNKGNPLFAALVHVRQTLKEHIGRLFNQQHTAFLSGILLGDKDEFSPTFLEKLSTSGTMHLMALSGSNMIIIIFIALGIFSVIFWGRKRLQFATTFGTVALFVAMTGFQVSAIRAALMASIVGLATLTHRLYRPHNALALAALIIAVWNPKAPVFDLGFQLSFLATLAIIYLAPVLKRLPFLQTEGTLGWRDALAVSAAAQLGVAPITIINFANFSFTGLLANIAILAVIPVLTIMGFLVALFSMVFPPLALLIREPIAFLIDYVVSVVETFAVVYAPFNPEVGLAAATLYYCVVIWICWRWSPALRA